MATTADDFYIDCLNSGQDAYDCYALTQSNFPGWDGRGGTNDPAGNNVPVTQDPNFWNGIIGIGTLGGTVGSWMDAFDPNRRPTPVVNNNTANNTPLYIGMAIMAIFLLVILLILLFKK